MGTYLVIALVILLIGLVVWFAFFRNQPAPQQAPVKRERTIRDLEPGDVISYWNGSEESVVAALAAMETVNDRTTRWRWAILDSGRLIEASPEGLTIYDDPEVIYQGSADFEKFVPPQGALSAFEERVREGIVGSQPVFVEHRGRRYRIQSTGTFGATTLGDVSERPVWSDVSPDPSQNVYFEMEAAPDQEAAGDREVLGIWTSHLLLYYGVPLDEGSVKGLYTR